MSFSIKSTYSFIVTLGTGPDPDTHVDAGGDLTFTLSDTKYNGSGTMEGVTYAVTAVSAVRVTEASGSGSSDDGATASDSVTTRPASKSRLYRNGAGRPIS